MKKQHNIDFSSDWNLVPAPESTANIKLKESYDLFINGKFVKPKSGKYFDTINPANEKVLAKVAEANEEDIDLAMTKGVNYPKGLLAWADEKGIDWCVSQLDDLYDEYHEDRYRCSPLLRKMNKENMTFF